MTRTKAEAIANPQAGDRWKSGNVYRQVLKNATWRVEFQDFLAIVNHYPPPKYLAKDEFACWAKSEEYLGGIIHDPHEG